jgi:hypothetical protein
MATLAIPELRDEGSGGNARASRTRTGIDDGIRASRTQGRLGWKGALHRKSMYFRRAPDSNQGCRVCT